MITGIILIVKENKEANEDAIVNGEAVNRAEIDEQKNRNFGKIGIQEALNADDVNLSKTDKVRGTGAHQQEAKYEQSEAVTSSKRDEETTVANAEQQTVKASLSEMTSPVKATGACLVWNEA